MICPHCTIAYSAEERRVDIGSDADGLWLLVHAKCPECDRMAMSLAVGHMQASVAGPYVFRPEAVRLVHPAGGTRPCPPEVPPELGKLYEDAALVLPLSPTSAAALARRCLQQLLHSHNIKTRDLAKEIEALLATKTLPSHVAETVDSIRVFGNFAAHPIPDNAGAVVDIEPGEAEATLDVLDDLFDFYYVAPARSAARRAAADAKQALVGKPPTQQPPP